MSRAGTVKVTLRHGEREKLSFGVIKGNWDNIIMPALNQSGDGCETIRDLMQ